MASTKFNITSGSSIEDAHFRYKCAKPQLVPYVKKGRKLTAIQNILEISKNLHRNETEIGAFFKYTLGVTTSVHPKLGLLIQGEYDNEDIQVYLQRYIESFVLCETCSYPETEYTVINALLHQDCSSCGAQTPVPSQHKLTSAILKTLKTSSELDNKITKKEAKQEAKRKKNSERDTKILTD
jgi:translation initiation factor 2 beta subunit (eIF-2beta)/eIF-5